jgi:hypothetical protein
MKYGLGVLSVALHKGRPKVTERFLRKWNAMLAVLFVVEGIALLLLSVPRDVALYVAYLAGDPLQSALQHVTVATAAVHQLAMVNVTYIVAALCFVAALAHIVRATVGRSSYETHLGQRNVLLHPAQMAGEAALLLVLLGLLGGMYDVGSLMLTIASAGVLGLALSLIGTVRTGAGKQSDGSAVAKAGNILWLAGLVPAAVVLLHMVAGTVFGVRTSAYVYLAYVTTLALAVAIAVNIGVAQSRSGKQGDTMHGTEWRFMVVNFVGITLVCIELFAGLLRP